MTVFEAIWDTLTGQELQKASRRNEMASRELTQAIRELSREEKALGEIGKMFREGKPRV